MCLCYCITAVACTMLYLTRIRRPAGRKVILFSGDFWKLLPIIAGGAQIVYACFKSSSIYQKFLTLQFTENMQLTAFQNDPNADALVLLFPSFRLELKEGPVPFDER